MREDGNRARDNINLHQLLRSEAVKMKDARQKAQSPFVRKNPLFSPRPTDPDNKETLLMDDAASSASLPSFRTAGARFSTPEIEYHPELADESDSLVIDVDNLAGPPEGYSRLDRGEPWHHRLVKEAYALWLAPVLNQLPNIFNAWWKGARARAGESARNRAQAGAAEGLRVRMSAMTSAQLFSGQVAAATGIVIVTLVLLYALVARSKRHNRVIMDASSKNVEEDKIVYYIPKKKFLIDQSSREDRMDPGA